MSADAVELPRTTRPLRPEVLELLPKLTAGVKIRIIQTVRVGSASWEAVTTGAFRCVRSMATGLATERVRADDILVPTIHFTKDNGEHSSIALDENTRVELVSEKTE